jgi:hypothetical protein
MDQAAPPVRDVNAGEFSMDGYLTAHNLEVVRKKPWASHPSGFIYELARCPFNPDHVGGSASFTLLEGKPGFKCQHNGCTGKTIRDVFAMYPPESETESPRPTSNSENELEPARKTQSQLLLECAQPAELFRDCSDVAFANMAEDSHTEIWPVRSKRFIRWLVRE